MSFLFEFNIPPIIQDPSPDHRNRDRDYELYHFNFTVRQSEYGNTELDAMVNVPHRKPLLERYKNAGMKAAYERIIDIVDYHLK